MVLLRSRVDERFPQSGLAGLCRELERIARQTSERAASIARPILSLRLGVALLLAVIAAGLAGTALSVRVPKERIEVFQFIQVLESGINDLVLVGAGVFFLVTLETRIKRRRALAAIRELRAIAHIIDMHQLTKDPEVFLGESHPTEASPARANLTPHQLERYLDYCSEMLAVSSKVAALYVQYFQDETVLRAVDEVENLVSGLSRKIWQKITILGQLREVRLRPA